MNLRPFVSSAQVLEHVCGGRYVYNYWFAYVVVPPNPSVVHESSCNKLREQVVCT